MPEFQRLPNILPKVPQFRGPYTLDLPLLNVVVVSALYSQCDSVIFICLKLTLKNINLRISEKY